MAPDQDEGRSKRVKRQLMIAGGLFILTGFSGLLASVVAWIQVLQSSIDGCMPVGEQLLWGIQSVCVNPRLVHVLLAVTAVVSVVYMVVGIRIGQGKGGRKTFWTSMVLALLFLPNIPWGTLLGLFLLLLIGVNRPFISGEEDVSSSNGREGRRKE